MAIDSQKLREWVKSLVCQWGFSEPDADYLAHTLIDANMRGLDSHGVIRLPAYARRVQAGLLDPQAQPIVSRANDEATATIDAHGGAGQIASRVAVETVDTLANKFGIAAATVHGSTHFGTAGYYARSLAERGLIAIVLSNSESIVVPHGGRNPLLGTNPFAFAAPTSGHPLCLDMATSTSAMGKVLVAKAAGKAIPADWGINADGIPTSDPHEVVALLPAAGPKGFGLGMMVEILTGILGGAAVGTGIGNMYTDFSRPQNLGHLFLAIAPRMFLPYATFISTMDTLIDQIRSSQPAPGFDEVMAPGDPEQRAMSDRRLSGITLDSSTRTELRLLGEAWSVPFEGYKP